MEHDPIVALELLNKAANNVGELVDCVAKFTDWWSSAETMMHTLEDEVVSADGPWLDTIRNRARKSCEVLRKDYEIYRRSVSGLQIPSSII
jgi:hypothetical protein